ncbi:MAG: hypothetical protein K2N58_02670 [Treponemataceae bacterium]|nr:hypothetical protein [Treponemataceae bacterium]
MQKKDIPGYALQAHAFRRFSLVESPPYVRGGGYESLGNLSQPFHGCLPSFPTENSLLFHSYLRSCCFARSFFAPQEFFRCFSGANSAFGSIHKTRKITIDDLTATNKVPSEVSDGFTAFDEALELVEICPQQVTRTQTQPEISCQQLARTQTQGEIRCQRPLWTQKQPEISCQQTLWMQTQGEIPCQRLTRTQKQPEIVAARCAAYRVFLRKTREGSWESTKTAIFIRFAYNRRRGRRKKIDIRSIA